MSLILPLLKNCLLQVLVGALLKGIYCSRILEFVYLGEASLYAKL